MSKQDIGKEAVAMMLTGSFEDTDIDTLIKMLRAADDRYHNGQESFFSDADYDSVKQYAQQAAPDDLYFVGVGSEVRGGKVKLPFPMGSLTQAYAGDTKQWVQKHNLVDDEFIVTEKLDGISCLLIYGADSKLKIAYSRGDGTMGADITRHVSKIHRIPKQLFMNEGDLVVRAEIIFKKNDWDIVKTKITRSGGEFYKNARNCVAGLMNASESDPVAYQYLSVVAYEVIGQNISKEYQLLMLDRLGFATPHTKVFVDGSWFDDDQLIDILNQMRTMSEYEIDGIVLEVSDFNIRNKINPTKDTLNPEYARKFKIADASNYAETEVVEVQFAISKNGYLKPRIKIKPVELVGVTVQYATGFNAKFIRDNKIGPGAIIKIIRSGDVIPYIIGVIKSMPEERMVE